MSKTIIRSKKQKEFTTVSNRPFLDKNLSWAAKGLLGMLLTRPDDWKVYLSELSKHATNGKDSTKTAFDELIRKGYAVKSELPRKGGRFTSYDYTVYEHSIGEPERVHRDGKPATENPPLLNTNKLNTNKLKEEPKNGSTLFPSKKILSINDLKKLSIEEVKERFPSLNKYREFKGFSWKDIVVKYGKQTQFIEEVISFKKEERRLVHFALLLDWLEYRKERGKEYKFARSIKAPWKMILGYAEGETRIVGYDLDKAKRAVDWSIESEWLKIYYKKEDLKEVKQNSTFNDRGIGIQ